MLIQTRVAIANGAALSNEVDLGGHKVVAIQMPASWTAADLTLVARPGIPDGRAGTSNDALQDVYDSADAEVVIEAAAARYIVLDGVEREALDAIRVCKFRSGTTGVPVNQGAAREILLVTEPKLT